MAASGYYFSSSDNAWHPASWFKIQPTTPGSPTPGPPAATAAPAATTDKPVVNPAVLNALTLNWNRSRAELDDQTNRYRINYNSALDKMRRTYDDTGLKNREGFSDRGMLNSGPRLSTDVKLRDEYNRQQGQAGVMYNTNLATIAKRRLLDEQDYKNNTALATLGLANPTS